MGAVKDGVEKALVKDQQGNICESSDVHHKSQKIRYRRKKDKKELL
jgi:hypothetical protein